MKNTKRDLRFLTVGLIAAGLMLAAPGCDSDSDDDPGSITVSLDHRVDGNPLVFNDPQFENAAGNQYGVSKLEYIVTDVALKKKDGTAFEVAAHHYRNAGDASTQSLTATRVPAGSYSELVFTFGIKGEDNVSESLPNTVVYDNMAWPEQMGGGYHYMKLEGDYQAPEGDGSFLVHTGPTGGGDHSIEVVLPVALEVDGNDWEVQVIMNLNEWFTGPQEYNFPDYGMIMGDGDAQIRLQANGGTVFSVGFAREK